MSDLNLKSNKYSSKIIGIKPIKKNNPVSENNLSETAQKTKEQIQLADTRLKEATIEADRILENARQTVQEEQNEWQETKKELERKAEEAGRQAGLEQGLKHGYNEYTEMIKQARQVIEQAKNDYQVILSESEDVILHLALAAASKILKQEVTYSDRHAVLVKNVLKELKDQSKIIVYAHPEDYLVLNTQKDELINIVQFEADLTLYPDSHLERGACKIESAYGLIDAGIDSQLEELRKKLFELSRERNIENG